ncbi:hypothetical protein [uncultured Methanobrevibacter sp.]|uniref:hypothetical protein n=1 Tax=uncultured Methanobrevibacter sp. TaxID=253161 RepID=UPI0025F80444|nr:hypothetical protein [uncultured Methanobrevibacter sp.]
MNFEKYIDDIIQLIEVNINRLNNMDFPTNIAYHISSVNYFDLTFDEYQKLNSIIDEIYVENELSNKFPKNFIFDKLVSEVIVKSYDLTSTTYDIKLNLKQRFQRFMEILNEEIKDYAYFIPISGIYVEEKIILNSISIYPFQDFKNEILKYFDDNKDKFDEEEYFEYLIEELNRLNEYCFVKLTVNGTQETSRDIALNKVNELLSIFSLYKPHYCNGFGIMGNVLPLNSQITNYVFDSNDKLKILNNVSVRNRFFNLSESLNHMKGYNLDYLINLLNKEEFSYVENKLFNAIGWYYQSVKTEFIFKSDITEVSMNSGVYHEHYNYFKLGIKLINLISSLESLLIFNKDTSLDTRKKRFNNVVNYKCDDFLDCSEYLNEFYKLRHDIVHSNKKFNLLKFNLEKNTNLINMFIIKFIEIKFDFDNSYDKSLDSKDDLVRLYDRYL